MSKKGNHRGKLVGAYVPADLKEWLAEQAKNEGITASEKLRNILENARKTSQVAIVLANSFDSD